MEERKLTAEELDGLLADADPRDNIGFYHRCRDWATTPAEFFGLMAQEQVGFLADGRPFYFAALVNNELWTTISPAFDCPLWLFRKAREYARAWAKKHGAIVSCTGKHGKRCEWVQALGFKVVKDADTYQVLKMEG